MPNLWDDVQSALLEAEHRLPTPATFEGIIENVGTSAEQGVADAADELGAVAGAPQASVAYRAFSFLGWFGVVFQGLQAINWARNWLLHLTPSIPNIFGLRSIWVHIIASVFYNPSDWTNVYGQWLNTSAKRAVHGHIGFLNWALPLTEPFQHIQTATSTGAVDLSPLYGELHADEGEIAQLQHRVDWIESHLSLPAPTPAPNLVPLQEQINTLAGRLAAAEAQLSEQQAAINHQEGLLITLVNDFAVIQSELQGVRSTVTSWPEIQRSLQEQTTTLTSALADTNARVGEQGDFLAQLAPLAILALAPAKGIENLRKLEDDPCQCPQLPGLPGDMAGLLALYEFITHG